MKTLNSILRTVILVLSLVGTVTSAFAYSFMVNGIYYNINGDKATVTYLYRESHYSSYGNQYYTYFSDYKDEIDIPETVTYNGISYIVTEIGDHAFIDCIGLTKVNIPSTVVSINECAFSGCYGLKNITIPISVTSIGSSAFQQCSGLSYVIIPDSVTTVGSASFYGCSNITNVTIGKSVNWIGDNAFGYIDLSSITCLATTPPSASVFTNANTAKLYVPKESVDLYRTTSGWNFFTNVYGFGNDSFSVPDNTAFHGDTIVIPVSMQNESAITAFQTDIYLAEGFELVKKNDEYQVSLSDRKGRDHVIMVNDAPDGAIRVLSYSPTLKAFKNNEGELFYITVKVPEGVSGTFPIWLRNTVLTSTDEEELYAIDALSNVSVTNIIMGDVNNDGIVTVSDVVTTARYILNYNPEPFVFEAADMNADSKITITDVVKIANLILDQEYEEPETMRGAGQTVTDCMSGEAIGNTISINLDNAMAYTALQMDLILPEGMTASDFALANRANSLSLNVKEKGNGKVRVLAYTPNLKTIKGNNGEVLTFNVAGTKGDILVDRIELVNVDGKAARLNAFTIGASNVTELDELAAGKAIAKIEYFNLAGQQISEPAIGVTLVVTTYTDGKRTTNKIIR